MIYSSLPMSWVPSPYNFQVPTATVTLLYSSLSGAVLALQGDDGPTVANLLTGRGNWHPDVLPQEVLDDLIEGRFLLPEGIDAVAEIRERFWRARRETPIVLTVATTQDCNLGCFYCYEERSGERLAVEDAARLASVVRERLTSTSQRSLHVCWYGGEPLLNIDFIEAASPLLQQLCDGLHVDYHASAISNGSCWPENAAAFAVRHRLRQVQISLDGMPEGHNRIRHYRKGYANRASPFDEAVRVIDQLLDVARVDLRLNIGPHNREDALPMLRMARTRGWFRRPYPCVIQAARVSAYSDHCDFLRPHELTIEEFDELRNAVRDEVAGEAPVQEPEVPDGLPLPRNSVCSALVPHSALLGPDGLEYRCGLQLGQKTRAVDRLLEGESPFRILSENEYPDVEFWRDFDPTERERCSRCSFLPICWGGCAEKHLRGDAHAIQEQGAFWRANLPRLIAKTANTTAQPGFIYQETDQFREPRRL